jgi:mono/diheme cytochrome c family protein
MSRPRKIPSVTVGCVLAALIAALLGPGVSAADAPRLVWVKAKCALCHGIDGAGSTDTGRKLKTPDLRSPAIQKLGDEALTRSISAGHKGMPSFRKQMSAENVRILIAYVRALGKDAAAASSAPK